MSWTAQISISILNAILATSSKFVTLHFNISNLICGLNHAQNVSYLSPSIMVDMEMIDFWNYPRQSATEYFSDSLRTFFMGAVHVIPWKNYISKQFLNSFQLDVSFPKFTSVYNPIAGAPVRNLVAYVILFLS